MKLCPRCGAKQLRRSRRKGWSERLFLSLVRVMPYRCVRCNWRFRRLSLAWEEQVPASEPVVALPKSENQHALDAANASGDFVSFEEAQQMRIERLSKTVPNEAVESQPEEFDEQDAVLQPDVRASEMQGTVVVPNDNPVAGSPEEVHASSSSVPQAPSGKAEAEAASPFPDGLIEIERVDELPIIELAAVSEPVLVLPDKSAPAEVPLQVTELGVELDEEIEEEPPSDRQAALLLTEAMVSPEPPQTAPPAVQASAPEEYVEEIELDELVDTPKAVEKVGAAPALVASAPRVETHEESVCQPAPSVAVETGASAKVELIAAPFIEQAQSTSQSDLEAVAPAASDESSVLLDTVEAEVCGGSAREEAVLTEAASPMESETIVVEPVAVESKLPMDDSAPAKGVSLEVSSSNEMDFVAALNEEFETLAVGAAKTAESGPPAKIQPERSMAALEGLLSQMNMRSSRGLESEAPAADEAEPAIAVEPVPVSPSFSLKPRVFIPPAPRIFRPSLPPNGKSHRSAEERVAMADKNTEGREYSGGPRAPLNVTDPSAGSKTRTDSLA